MREKEEKMVYRLRKININVNCEFAIETEGHVEFLWGGSAIHKQQLLNTILIIIIKRTSI